jgi:hypothetical protein
MRRQMMNRCLSDRALLMLHEGEGSEQERRHLKDCAECDRRYRRMIEDVEEIVAILSEPAPLQSLTLGGALAHLKWAVAAAALLTAFICGRLTNGISGVPSDVHERAFAQISVPIQSPEFAARPTFMPASYGLYVDNLMSLDESEPNLDPAADNEASNIDDF